MKIHLNDYGSEGCGFEFLQGHLKKKSYNESCDSFFVAPPDFIHPLKLIKFIASFSESIFPANVSKLHVCCFNNILTLFRLIYRKCDNKSTSMMQFGFKGYRTIKKFN